MIGMSKEIVEVMDTVAELVEDICTTIKKRDILFVNIPFDNLEGMFGVLVEFKEANEESYEVVANILAEEVYQERYDSIGAMSKASMEDAESLLDGESETDFGKRMVRANVHFALMQDANGYEEIDYNATFSLSELDMAKDIKVAEEINTELTALVRKLLVFTEGYKVDAEEIAVMISMTNENFHSWVKECAKREESKENKIFGDIVIKMMDVETELGRESAGVHMKMMRRAMDNGEIHPLEAMLNLQDLVAGYIDYVMSVVIESFYVMRIDGESAETVDVNMVMEDIDNR